MNNPLRFTEKGKHSPNLIINYHQVESAKKNEDNSDFTDITMISGKEFTVKMSFNDVLDLFTWTKQALAVNEEYSHMM